MLIDLNIIGFLFRSIKMSIIKSIDHFTDPRMWEGYTFELSDSSKSITCKLSNYKNCCEIFGITTTPSNLTTFVGAKYISITVERKTPLSYTYDHDTIIAEITILTDCGTIKIELWNSHNGYYPHDYIVISEHGLEEGSI